MTLHEFMKVCGNDDYIGIYNMDTPIGKKNPSRKRFEEMPTQQNYFRIGNIPYERIGRFLDYEVIHINHTEKGFLVRIGSLLHRQEMDNRRMAREIARAIKG